MRKSEKEIKKIENEFSIVFKDFLSFAATFKPSQVNHNVFENYSAKNVTKQLADLLNKAILNQPGP